MRSSEKIKCNYLFFFLNPNNDDDSFKYDDNVMGNNGNFISMRNVIVPGNNDDYDKSV